MSHSQKSVSYCFDKSAKNVKNNGLKTELIFLVCKIYHKSIGKCWIAVQDIHLIFQNSNL